MSEEVEAFISRLTSLQEKLQQQSPDYKTLLSTIHSNLRKDPDLVHILSNEQIGVIVAGLSKHTGITLVEATLKRSSKAPKVTLSSLGLDGLDDLL